MENGQTVYLVKLLNKPVIEEMIHFHAETDLPRLLIAFLESRLRFVIGNPDTNIPDIEENDTPNQAPYA